MVEPLSSSNDGSNNKPEKHALEDTKGSSNSLDNGTVPVAPV